MKIQAFQTPISNTGIADMIRLLFTTFRKSTVGFKLSVVLSDFIVNKHLVAGSEEYHLTGQGNSDANE
jgi:hypothetical protein